MEHDNCCCRLLSAIIIIRMVAGGQENIISQEMRRQETGECQSGVKSYRGYCSSPAPGPAQPSTRHAENIQLWLCWMVCSQG